MGDWRRVKQYRTKRSAYKKAKAIVAKQGCTYPKDPNKVAFFGKYRNEAKIEFDKEKKVYTVYKRRMW